MDLKYSIILDSLALNTALNILFIIIKSNIYSPISSILDTILPPLELNWEFSKWVYLNLNILDIGLLIKDFILLNNIITNLERLEISNNLNLTINKTFI